MTPSQYIKAQGLPNLQYVADKVGKHRDTLDNWYHKEYALFEAVVIGVWKLDVDAAFVNIQDQIDKIGVPLTEDERETFSAVLKDNASFYNLIKQGKEQ